MKKPLLSFLALALALALCWPLTAAQAQQLKLRVLHTSDLHMHLLGWDYFQDRAVETHGLDRTATLIKAARSEARNTLLFDNGDLLQGSPLGDFIARVKPLAPGEVHPAVKALNTLRFDAAAVGNHEFNFGLPFLRQAIAGAQFPFLSANIVVDETGPAEQARPAFTPYVLLERRFVDEAGQPHTLKVGVIGLVPPQVMLWDRQHLQGRVRALDMVSTARRLVPRMKAEGADVVVVLAHSGFARGELGPMAENVVGALAEVPGVNAILFGHSHGEFPGAAFAQHAKVDLAKGTINGVPAAMPGAWGSHLGVIDLVLNRQGAQWQVADARAEIRPIHDRATRKALVAPDPEIIALVKPSHEGAVAHMRAEVARTTAPIHSYFAQVMDDPSVQLVSQAQLAYARRALAGTPLEKLPLLSASAPFKTGGRGGPGNYTDIATGPLALRNVADLYIFPNTVKVVKLRGAQVREWLEFSAGAFNQINPAGPAEQNLLNPAFPSFNFDTLDGLSYRIDVTQPARYERSGKLAAPNARRIVDLQYQGRPVADDAEFLVVTNNYRASGGGSFPGLDGSNIVLDAPDENREALVQYLQTARTVNPTADGNWRILPVPGVKLRFVSGAGGIPHLARAPQVRLVQDQGDGTALFELQP